MARRLSTSPHPYPQNQQTGAPPSSATSLVAEVTLVRRAWQDGGLHTEQTLLRMTETVSRFSHRLGSTGYRSFGQASVGEVAGFVNAPLGSGREPELATRHARRTALRTLYRTLRSLGLASVDPTLDLQLPPRGTLAARPLTEDEVSLCRASAQMTRGRWASMRSVAWALGEATAVSSEIAAVAVADVDDLSAPTAVLLPGTRRHDARVGRLSHWGRQVVVRRVDDLRAAGAGPGALLAYGGLAPAGTAKAQASVCNALRDVLGAAGLSAEPDVRPGSLRHWTGRAAYDAGEPLEAVARLLGHRSLDATAEDIGLDWREVRPRFEQGAVRPLAAVNGIGGI
jgi:site-specific recombinase XerD